MGMGYPNKQIRISIVKSSNSNSSCNVSILCCPTLVPFAPGWFLPTELVLQKNHPIVPVNSQPMACKMGLLQLILRFAKSLLPIWSIWSILPILDSIDFSNLTNFDPFTNSLSLYIYISLYIAFYQSYQFYNQSWRFCFFKTNFSG